MTGVSISGSDEKTRILWAGDSTVQMNGADTYPQTGMGQTLSLFCREGVGVHSFAQNGASTKSFIALGLWDNLMRHTRAGDVVLIEFGHNDNKPESPERYTKPYEDFAENLKFFASQTRAKAAFPVLITPLARQKYSADGKLSDTHGDYYKALLKTAKDEAIPLIDLTKASTTLIEALGKERASRLFMQFGANTFENYKDGMNDTTHLVYQGAVEFSRLIAHGLYSLGGAYSQLIKTEVLR